MMKPLCDRCGAIIDSPAMHRQITDHHIIDDKKDLCLNCYTEFNRFMDGEHTISIGVPK